MEVKVRLSRPSLVLAQREGKGMSWRFGILPCSQNAHAQKVLVRCAQSEETKPHSRGMGGKEERGKAALAAGKGRVLARPGRVGAKVRAVQDGLSAREVE
jgi:hypothetical protein